MKTASKFFAFMLALNVVPVCAAPVATTAGSNNTAYNPGFGTLNNNDWNSAMNSRTGGNAPTADFGNCNALILRCASPKCGNGGCTDASIARPIVEGCVKSNSSCKKHGNTLIDAITAQIIASSMASFNAANQQAQMAAASAQNDEQLQYMQNQMAQTQAMLESQTMAMNQLQSQLSAQQEATNQAIENAVAAAQQAAASAAPSYDSVADYGASSGDGDIMTAGAGNSISAAQRVAAESGVDPNLIQRAQVSGEVLTGIENAEHALDQLKKTMEEAFEYGGCDSRGNNCSGPKRVALFKEKAQNFFDPYDNVVDQLYDALTTAQAVGVNMSNIYYYLNDSCNKWGKYACGYQEGESVKCKTIKADKDGKVTEREDCELVSGIKYHQYDKNNCPNGTSNKNGGGVRGGHECIEGQLIPPEDDVTCTLIGLLKENDNEDVAYNWLYPEDGELGNGIRVGCASGVLDSAKIFASRGKRKRSTVDIDTLRRIVEQDSVKTSTNKYGKNSVLGDNDVVKYCGVTVSDYAQLQRLTATRSMPKTNVCVKENFLNRRMNETFIINDDSYIEQARLKCIGEKTDETSGYWSPHLKRCFCEKPDTQENGKPKCDEAKSKVAFVNAAQRLCNKDLKHVCSMTGATVQCTADTTKEYDEDGFLYDKCKYYFDLNGTKADGVTEELYLESPNEKNNVQIKGNDLLTKEQQAAELKKIGDQIKFNAQFNPALNSFLKSGSKSSKKVDENGGGRTFA